MFLAELMPSIANRKIEAIREVREQFGLDLKDAKEVVGRYYAREEGEASEEWSGQG